MRVTVALVAACTSLACAGQPALGPRRISPDSALVFEQRRANRDATTGKVDWEAWQLYESGRFVYTRAGIEPSRTRLERARLHAVKAWLAQHDFELVRSRADRVPNADPSLSASCQLQLSTGLVLAPLGDARYYACDELRRLSEGEP